MRRERRHEEHRDFPSGFVLKNKANIRVHYEKEAREGRGEGVTVSARMLGL